MLLRDEPKPDAAAIRELKELGIRRTAMLSNDSRWTAEEIGRELSLDAAIGELPQDKLTGLKKLRQGLNSKGKLLYGGDSINDTLACV